MRAKYVRNKYRMSVYISLMRLITVTRTPPFVSGTTRTGDSAHILRRSNNVPVTSGLVVLVKMWQIATEKKSHFQFRHYTRTVRR